MIQDIRIKNVKGYGDPEVKLDLCLFPNKINLLFAPNGFGKSSLAAAFNALTRNGLNVSKENKYHKDESLESSLSIDMDGIVYRADSRSNNITPVLSCHVIKRNTEVHTTQRNLGKFTSVSGYVDIIDIDIEPIVPYKSSGYSISTIRRAFGSNGKILDNLESGFNNKDFLYSIKPIYGQLDSFARARTRTRLIDDV